MWKEYGKEGINQEGINQRGNKETKDNPEGAAKHHIGDWGICPQDQAVHSTELGFMEEWPEKSNCLQKKISKHVWCSPKSRWETPQTYGTRFSGQMRLNVSFLSIKENGISFKCLGMP